MHRGRDYLCGGERSWRMGKGANTGCRRSPSASPPLASGADGQRMGDCKMGGEPGVEASCGGSPSRREEEEGEGGPCPFLRIASAR